MIKYNKVLFSFIRNVNTTFSGNVVTEVLTPMVHWEIFLKKEEVLAATYSIFPERNLKTLY